MRIKEVDIQKALRILLAQNKHAIAIIIIIVPDIANRKKYNEIQRVVSNTGILRRCKICMLQFEPE